MAVVVDLGETVGDGELAEPFIEDLELFGGPVELARSRLQGVLHLRHLPQGLFHLGVLFHQLHFQLFLAGDVGKDHQGQNIAPLAGNDLHIVLDSDFFSRPGPQDTLPLLYLPSLLEKIPEFIPEPLLLAGRHEPGEGGPLYLGPVIAHEIADEGVAAGDDTPWIHVEQTDGRDVEEI